MESRVWEVCSLLPFAASGLGKEKKAIVIDLLLVAAGS